MFGLSTKKCECPSPVRRGTSPVSTASRLTLPNARSGTARTPLQFYLLKLSPLSRRRTASITRRSRRSRFAGSHLIQNNIGALTLRGSYTEAFHAPALSEISPASSQDFSFASDPLTGEFSQFEVRVIGNPNLQPEVAYEWSYGAVYSPKCIKGLTLSVDWWHIDMRSIASLLGAQFIVENNIPGLVIRGPSPIPGEPGPIILVIDPNENLTGTIFEGLDRSEEHTSELQS